MTSIEIVKRAYDLGPVNPHAAGNQRLYRLDPPLEQRSWFDEDEDPEKHEYVVVSAVVAMFSGPETYIFPSNEHGKITDWEELDGSYRGGMDHEAALAVSGYEVVKPAEVLS